MPDTMKAKGGKFRSTICGIGHIFFYQIILYLETPLESLLKTHLQDPLEVILWFHHKTS